MATRSRGVEPARQASARYAWWTVSLAGWLLVGIALVARANNLGLVNDISYSPHHAPAYAGLIVLLLFVTVSVTRAGRRSWRRAFPDRYAGIALGAAVLVAWIVVDLLYRGLLDIRPGIEAGLAPSRLLLPIGVGLVASGPLLDGIEAPRVDQARGSRDRLPGVLSLGILAAVAAAFLGFHPAASVWSERAARSAQDGSEIWVMAPDGSHQERLVRAAGNGTDYSLPVWSPDGTRIAFTEWKDLAGDSASARLEEQVASIWTMAADGTDPVLVVAPERGYDWIPTWSPDGAWILYTSSPVRAAGSGSAGGPAPGPDLPGPGRMGPSTGQPTAERWIVHPDGSGRSQLTTGPGDDLGGAWSPDGRQIAFVSDRDGNQEIYLADVVDGTAANERRLTNDPGEDWAPAWSPDGARVAFTSDRAGNADIWFTNVDGTGLAQLTAERDNDWVPAWSPDGNRIAFASERGGDAEVWSMAADGRDVRNLSNSPSRIDGLWSVAWSPDGSSIAYASAALPPLDGAPILREDLAAAGMLLQGVLLAVVALLLVRLRGPFGSFAVVLVLSVVVAAALVSDDWRFVPAVAIGGLVVDALVAAVPEPYRARAAAALLPVALVLAVGLTLAVTGALGWSVTLLLGVSMAVALLGWTLGEVTGRLGRLAS